MTDQMAQPMMREFQEGRYDSFLEMADRALAEDPGIPELHYMRCLCLRVYQRYAEAYQAAQAELARNPSHAGARLEIEWLEPVVRMDALSQSGQNTWDTLLPASILQAIQRASFSYSYRGVAMIKNPFDFALYPRLLWNAKPATVIEIGSYAGGSAIWLADTLANFGVDSQVYSIDIHPITSVKHPHVTFMEGSGRELGKVLTPDWMAKLPRPMLVIEDADHTAQTTGAVLDFFDPHLRAGENIIVEDAILEPGVRQAITDFLSRHPGEYEIDRNYCDFFGYNVTWNFNGYLRKV